MNILKVYAIQNFVLEKILILPIFDFNVPLEWYITFVLLNTEDGICQGLESRLNYSILSFIDWPRYHGVWQPL